jgi:hypothetical protein
MTTSIAPHRSFHLAAALTALALGGCGSSPTVPVEGTVVYADAPDTPATDLAGYAVTFESDGGDHPPASAAGTVGPDGTFRMSTFQDGDGALKGRQKVALTPPLRDDGAMVPSKILAKYQSIQTSGLTVDVQPGTNKVTLTVERKPRLK